LKKYIYFKDSIFFAVKAFVYWYKGFFDLNRLNLKN
jgi:hypothetical protein